MDLTQLLSRRAVEGLDIQKGIALYDGRISVYMEVLVAFYEQGPRQIAAMRTALSAGDFARYGIETHALKSAARGIGAVMLGDLAAESDAARKLGDTDAMKKKSGRLLRRYKALIDALSGLGLSDTEGAGEKAGRIEAEEMRGRLEEASARAEGYDLSAVSDTLRDLLRYEMDAAITASLRSVLSLSLQFQYEETEQALREIIQQLTDGEV